MADGDIGARVRRAALWGPALAALALLCWFAARWTWVILAPRAAEDIAPRETIDLRAERDAAIGAGLFGRRQEFAEQAKPLTPLNLKLLGVFAARGGAQSYAVLNLNGKGGELTAAGKELSPGVVLHEVHPDHVLISREGLVERVEFPGAARGARAQFNLDVRQTAANQLSFSRSTLDQALQSPGQLAQLGALKVEPGSGVTISQAPPGSLAQKLSLQPGDQIQRVNGQAVGSYEDLARLYQQFTGTGEVTLEGTRNGAPLKLSYVVQP
jgi:general secretion pathway protein C